MKCRSLMVVGSPLVQTHRLLLCQVNWVALLFFLFFGSIRAQATPYKVLVFSKTAGFRHDSITNGIAAIQTLGATNNFSVDASEDSTVFTGANLAQFKAVVFLSTTGDILDANQQAAFERYIEAGGGFVGIHAAADTEYGWPWYGGLVSAYFASHPAGTPVATIKVADQIHPSTTSLPKRWVRTDEWYNFQTNPRGTVHVLATVDETTYSGGTMGFDHPIAWCHEYDGGRAWYTAGGHTPESFSEPLFLAHIVGGIEFAAGVKPADCGATIDSNYQKVILDATPADPMELAVAPDGRVFYIERGGKLKIYKPQNSSIVIAGQIAVSTTIEDGLLGLTLDPGFATNNWLYLFYSPAGSTPEQHISRFTMVGDTLDLSSEKILLIVPTQRDECCHSGGSLTFGPGGNLFASVGDNTNPFDSSGYAPIDERPGRSAWDAQKSASNANDLRGKILRIHPETNGTYTIPAGNLFPTNGSSGKPEIYVMGNRNPFRIAVDSATGWLYWGEVGPDANVANASRGPAGLDEWNQARSAGNYGWPYFVGDNKPYIDYNFDTGVSGAAFNPSAPVNNSPNNTGATNLPVARSAWIWYPYAASTEFPEVNGGGGRTAMGGPVYLYQSNLVSSRKLPRYYDNTVFIYEWSRNFIKEVKLDDSGNVLKINPFLPSFTFTRPMDMEIGPDGAIYMLEWGNGFGGGNTDAKVIRIDYVGGNRAPVAVASATPDNGSVPLMIQFSSAGSFDHDTNDVITLAWSFFGNGSTNSTAANPAFTYTNAGNYTAQLTVTDSQGSQTIANVPIWAGNNKPVVTIQQPPNGAFFNWGEAIRYQLAVSDVEDGSTTNGTIPCSSVILEPSLGHNDHAHPQGQFSGCAGQIVAPINTDSDADNLFLVLAGSYTDNGAPNVSPLTGRTTYVLQPKHKQAEFFTTGSGVLTQPTSDPNGGGLDIVGIDHGDYISFSPMNLTNINAVIYRVAAGGLGGRIEVHMDSPGGALISTANIPVTGGSYTNVTAAITNSGGTHELFFVFLRNSGDAGLFVLNWLEFQGNGVSLNQTPFSGTPLPIPGTIETENFDNGGEGVAYHDNDPSNNGVEYRLSDGVDIQSTTDVGGGYNVGWVEGGEWMEYTVNVATSGLYTLEARFTSTGDGGIAHVEFDGVDKTGPLDFPDTGGWQNWFTMVKLNVPLNAGQQVTRLAMDSNGGSGLVANFNYLRFTFISSNNPPSVTITNPANSATFSAPANITLNATATDADGSVSKVEVFANGNPIGTDTASPFSVLWTNVPVGFYTLTARATDNVGLTAMSAPVNISVINGEAPFFGLPQSIPGKIQAEDFDGGGEGFAFHDTDTANNGGQYRNTSVDIENTADTGGGYNVGFTAGGEWLKYTVNATVDGIYSLGVRVASMGNAGTFHIEIEGVNKTGTMTMNDTGGWQTWTTMTKTNLAISAGQHVIRLALDTTGANGTVGNYNYFTFAATSTNTPVFLQSAVTANGTFADDGAASINLGAKTITIPQTTTTRFYRLRSTISTRITNIQLLGTNVVMTYQ
ncbi:MAG: ThuA domain-containing protein [Verrucomicrobia bacterium]|nr:ThuA domain-containing protein [Verrucomicrobiota bacterium]